MNTVLYTLLHTILSFMFNANIHLIIRWFVCFDQHPTSDPTSLMCCVHWIWTLIWFDVYAYSVIWLRKKYSVKLNRQTWSIEHQQNFCELVKLAFHQNVYALQDISVQFFIACFNLIQAEIYILKKTCELINSIKSNPI